MKKRILYHILFWTGYVLFKTYLNYISSGQGAENESAFIRFWYMLVAQLSLLTVKVPMVYTLFYILDRYMTRKDKIVSTGLYIVLLFSSSIAVYFVVNNYIIFPLLYNLPPNLASSFTIESIIYTLFILGFVAGMAMAFKLVRHNIRQKELGQEIMKKKLETELQFLKSQTNPHFLFNTLNNIYALARKKSEETPEVVMKLSKLLRFMLYESQNPSIPINTELKMIDDYIRLEQIRYDKRLQVSYLHDIDNESQAIAPLILLPFVENAFKFGVSESRFDSFININVKLHNEQLDFVIENPVAAHHQVSDMGKIGLTNVSRQLELMYPEHRLNIENDNNRFKVSLKINLKKYATI